ncbi:non-ribosomal peptide synthase/polyketide synthase [Longimicrobium sp.]|uniref:non-ribosomal peptide synthetase n=1 Tax=Longimicrobium sp. TaxID=2029185 RepID=UPI003B3B6AA6
MTLTPSVASAEKLLKLARAARLQRSPAAAPIEPAERGARLPLSFAQQRLWFLEQLGGLGDTYHLPTRLRLGRELDRPALRRALDAIVARHEALRTTFVEVDGEPVQRIAEESRFHLLEHDLADHPDPAAELRRLTAEEVGAPFDLEHGPLIRGRLIRLPGDDHLLLMTMHHIVSDGWSVEVLTRELGTLYEAFRRGEANPLPPLAVQYADYAIWQRKWVDGEVLRQQAEYWKTTLAGAPGLLELPADRPRPARQDHAGATLGFDLGEELTAGLKALGQRHGATPSMTLLAGWAAVLSRLSGQEDVVIGMPSANRGRAEVEGLIGFFINTLALRVDLSRSPSVAELLEQVRARSLGAQQHQDIPFEQVVDLVRPARSMAHTPLFQVMFAWQSAAEGRAETPGPRAGGAGSVSRAATLATAKFDLSLVLWEAGGRIVGSLTYATALFEQATMERHLAYLRRALEGMAADALQPVDALPLLPEAERRLVVEAWNATDAPYPRELCIHELFQAQVARTPDAAAVVCGEEALSYAELNARANRLAHHLRTLGVGPDARVAICVERSPEMVVGVLAVLKAGGAYVPLDPANPAERLRYMLEDSAPTAVLTQTSLLAAEEGLFAGMEAPVLALDAPAWGSRPATDPERGAVNPSHLAYVIYTSGSTGLPKGVMIAHRSLANLVAWHTDAFALEPGSRSSSVAGVGFDAAAWEIWPALCSGATLLLPRDARNPQALLEWWTRQRMDVSFLPTPVAEFAFDRGMSNPSLRTLLVGGDQLRHLPGDRGAMRVVNNYGPTEATVVATSGEVASVGALHIGRPIHNGRIYLLDRRGEPVPVGVAGELYVGGAGIGRGYLRRPALTAERFVPDPFGGEPGARLYRTGDLARWRPDGTIDFLGRNDFQVKIRGFRIELGEIEARLREHSAVREAVVLAREDAAGERRLVAYCTSDAALDVEALRARLSERLPEYMVPAAYVRLEALPLTPNGKLDRKALPAPEGDAFVTRGYEAPVGDTEQALAEVWAELLRVERVGRRDNFFQLGGHSLLAVRVISRIRQVLGAEVALGDLFERPVLADLARAIGGAARTGLPPIEPADRSGPLPLSFAQQRLWFIERLKDAGAAYHIPVRQRLRGDLDRDALRRALDRIVARHESLRTTFAEEDGEPVQRIASAEESPFHLVEHDLRGHPHAGAELRRLMAEEAGAPFDLARGPLIRGRLVRMADDDHVLLITMHHIVSDGWSMEVFTRELGQLYDAFRAGRPDPLPPLAVQYADYAAWQRRWMEGEVLREQAEYWREALSGAPELLELPADHARPARQDFTGATVGLVLDEALSAALGELSRRHGTTLYMTLLAGWAAVLARLSGQDDVVIGTPSANRGRAEIEGLIGFFVNMLPVRVELSDAPTVAELLARVRERALGAQHHQDIPFEQVVEIVHPVRSMAHTPLFQAMFTWQNAPGTGSGSGSGAGLPGLTPAPAGPARPPGDAAPGSSAGAAAQVTANVDLSLVLAEHGGQIAGSVTYAAALFERETVERWVGYLRRVLEGMAADETRRVDLLKIVPEAERALVLEAWSRTETVDSAESCVHALFEAQVQRAPDAEAVIFGRDRLSYAELNAAANRLARRLRAAGVGPEARVGVMLERGPELVVALLAVLKAGGAYLPLDPALPAARRAALAADAGAAVLVTREPGLEGFAGTIVSPAEAEGEEGDDLRLDVPPAALAYVIYTSGSTGTPKGVGVAHAEAAAHCRAAVAAYGLTPADRVLQFAAVGFDVSLEQMLAPLAAGACVVMRGSEVPTPLELARQAAEQGMTVINPPTAYWHQLAADSEALELLARSVRLVIAGGEAMSPVAAREWASGPAAGVRLVNGYGPTETVVTCTAYDVPAALPAGAVNVPVGRPIGGRTAYVLDGRGEPAPLGVPGELCIGGVLARGYLGRPAATAESFVPDPFSATPGARMYRTGDRARWLAVGELEFLGRRDHQVKVRGFRIEPAEIEARLGEHPEVRECVVLAREDAPGDLRLVAYVVGGEGVSAEALRAHLGAALPAYMIPSAFVRMDAFPLTPNGKLDRRALPVPDAPAPRTYEPPVGETEQALAEIFAEVLGVERVGRGDDFFALGGHSLLAVRVISRVRQVLGAEVALADLFEKPVLADLARAIASAAHIELPPIQPVERTGEMALSFAQQRLWFVDHLSGAGTAYHIPTRLRLRGELDREALSRALNRIVARHEALRTAFPASDGVPVQRIVPVEESRFHLIEHDLSGDREAQRELPGLLDEEARTPFDLARGPLIRGLLIRLAPDEHVLHVTMHHIVSDGWSMGVFTRELGALYGAFRRGEPDPLPPLPVQYADYAAWQRRWVEGDVLQAQADYWTQTLGGAPALLELPTDRPRPTRQDHAGGAVDVVMDEALTAGLKALSQRHGTTLFMTVLAAWAVVLGRLSGQHDVVVGTPSANRGRTEIEGLIGFFVNTLALRIELDGSPSVAQMLARVKARALGAQQHQDIPFEQVVELVQPTRSLAHNTLFQVMLTWQNASAGRLELPGLRLGGDAPASRVAAAESGRELPATKPEDEGAASDAAAKVDLALALWESGGRIVGSATYATALFEQATVQRWLGYLWRVLHAMAADDARATDRLELLDAAERSQVLQGWNRTDARLPRTCVHQRFEAQAARTPDAVALVFEDRSLTYVELNARANRLAHHLRGRGVRPDARVAVCIERSPELLVAFLAVLKSGGAYVPLDPGDPEERLRHMLDDGAPALLLAHAATAARFAAESIPVIDLDADARGWAGESAANPVREEVGLTPGHLAYVIYTSGSTGRPKGVMVEHRALANVMGWMAQAWPLGPDDVVLQKTPVSFDASARELYPPLLAGARMVIARPGGHRDPAYLVETIRREGVTTLHFVPTMLQFLLEEPGIERCTSIARIVCGGEALPAALARRAAQLLPHAELHNVYGPTEAAVDVTWLRVPAEVGGPHLSIGRPMGNCRAYFLDAAGEPAPLGVAGELYLGGAQVARGYLGRPALTAERFVPDSFGGQPGARLYRTGDLGRWLPDGTVEFLGRNDFQVKVRGFRIELGEIEARLREHEGVREAVVVAREDGAGDRRLVAYWTGDAVEVDALRAHLSGRLAEHMVPAAYVRLESMPLTSNGKLDRKALPAPEGDAYARRGYEAPQGETEQALAEIWGEVLGVERVGRHDSFFEVGGHSLLAVRLISRVRRALGVQVELDVVFERPVLHEMAEALASAGRAELPPIERVDRGAPLPLSFAQQRLWFLERLGGLGTAYHVPTRLRLRGELDRDALVRTLDRVVERHEALRTTFVEVEGEPVQRIAPPGGFPLLEHDLGGHADAEAELRRLAAEEWAAPFDLEHGPLIRGRLIRLAQDDHVLLVTMHHIVSDGWSRGVLTRELDALYAAFRRGDPDPLPPLPVQYADYAAWQRTWVEGEVLREQTEYWQTTLAGAPELLELPADFPRPARQDFAGGLIGMGLDEELTAGLKALGRRHGTTLFMTLLAGWAAVLARLSGQDDVVIGTPSANRGRIEIEGLIGFFINTLALRVNLAGSPTVAELLGQVRARALGAQRHQDIPFEQVVELMQPARSLAHTPLFQVMLTWQNAPEGELELSGLAAPEPDPRPAPAARAGAAVRTTAKFDLSLALAERDGRIVGAMEYAASLFERGTVERWAGYLRRVLEEMVADDSRPVERLAVMPESERALVLEGWNRTEADYPGGVPVHALFEAQAARTPSATAVVHGDQALSYAELNARANRLAGRLIERGVRSGDRVAIAMPRSLELVVAELAVLKAGAAYVPVDPSVPAERTAFMLADSGARIVLALPGAELATLSEIDRIDVGVLEDWATLSENQHIEMDVMANLATLSAIQRVDVHGRADGDARNPSVAVDGDAPAYVMYTSGSTGAPKGVVVPHRAITRLVINNGYADFGPDDRVAFAANPAFDASTLEVWAPLLNGGRIVIIPQDVLLEPRRFAAALATHGVDVLWMSVGLFNQYADELMDGIPRLRYLIVGGDALDPHVIARVLRQGPPRHLLNGYGPTETTTFAITHRITEVAEGRGIPLGRPIANTRIYVLDAHGEPVPVGVAGEMYVGGAGVALGYLDRPELTAERFVADPFGGEPGARMYRTGDVGRWRADGTIEFMGRTDFQVKVRGFRIELGEIEARLLAHPEVREAVVLAREDAPGDKRLVAYVVAEESVDAEALRAHVAARLPDYMVPAAYVRLTQLPLTPNGKVDRRALPAPEGAALATRGYEAPVDDAEAAVAAIWAAVLRVERVGRRDHFFELGGHSLLAVRVISRVRQDLGAEVALGELFERPVLADFARGLQAASRTGLPAIEPVQRGADLPLSFAQQRLWFIDRLQGAGPAYHITVRQRLRGGVDRVALRRALDRVVARHEALRTVFAEVNGEPVQRIVPVDESAFHLAEHDLRGHPRAGAELGRVMEEEREARFDLARGPLIRGRLIQLADDDHLLLITMHHIVSDGWSMGVLTRELNALYAAFRDGAPDPLDAPPIQYADYAVWQRRWVEGELLREQAAYWRETLAGAPELLELPADHARPARQDFSGGLVGIGLDEGLTAGLKALGQRHGATLFMTLLAGWAAVLARLSGQDDVVIGTPTANRGRSEIEGLIGFFVNTLALRVDLSGSPSVAELLARVKTRSLGAQQHQDIPFEQVVELMQPARSLSHTPLFQVMFTWQNAPGDELELSAPAAPEPASRPAPAAQTGAAARTTAKFDLSLAFAERDGRIDGVVEYAAALFERETVERFAGYLRRALEAMVADEHQPVDRLPLLPEHERRQVVEAWNATDAAYPADACVHEFFEEQATRTPDAVAVVFEGRALARAELNARANRLAHHLRSLGVGPDARVAICLERGPEMVIALLAVLKAGGAYVPLDPGYPAERITYMLADSAPAAVLTQRGLRERVEGASVPVLELDGGSTPWAAGPATDPERGALTPDHLAYVIYTSGSTGRPKGVGVPHRGVVNRLHWMGAFHGLGTDEVVLQKTPYGFDVSVWEFFWPLMAGARLVLARPEGHRDPGYLAETVRREGITTIHFVPSLLAVFLEHPDAGRCTGLRRVVTSGEALPPEVVARFGERLPGVKLHNLYGPTEASVDVTAWRCATDGSAARIPIGRPVANTRIYLLDARGEPVPVGVAGELYIGGVQVARGYQNRAGLTAERFVPDAFGGQPGARLYRTGDLARWRPDGTVEFLGRIDFQVKIRGLRIELGEIEARLAEHPEVREAVVVAREERPGDQRLVAYVVAPGSLGIEALRAHLSERLPEYMVPAAYVRRDLLPLTPNGTLDRKAGPAPDAAAFATRGYEAPASEREQALAEILADVLGVERVGRHDNFFELGGHSLLAVRVVSRVRQVLGVEVPLGELFRCPVLADLARAINDAARTELPPIERVDRGGRLPLSFAQARLWFLEQLGDLGSTYHIPTRLRLAGDLDGAALRRALDAIVARHEALRTTFVEVEGEPVQRIAAASPFHLLEHDLRAHPDAAAELRRLAAEEADAPFDLQHGPLIRGRLVRLADDEHVLLLTMHHIVSDGWSMGVLTRELDALYDAFRRGEADPLPPLPVQYADYAAWQRAWVDGEVLREQAAYWTTALAGAPELLELPTDHPRPARKDHAGAALGIDLGEELAAALTALGQRRGTTLFMTVLAGWAAVLARLSGQHDVVVGAPSANRGRAEIEGLIGFFVNTLALRVDVSGSPTVAELLEQVRARSLGAQQNQDIPFEQVVALVQPARSLAHTPLFQVMFAWQNAVEGRPELPGSSGAGGVGPASPATAKFDLALSLGETGGRITGSVTYATSLFEQATIERHLAYLRRVLEAMAADDLQPVDALPLLPESERRLVVEEWNRTEAGYPRGLCMHQLFEGQVRRTPDAVAVVWGEGALTYAELNARANRLARRLAALGAAPEAVVALALERSVEMVVALLAVAKTGAAFLPIDPVYPAERRRWMLERSAARLVLTTSALAADLPETEAAVVALDRIAAEIEAENDSDLAVDVDAENAAYVIFTSGSTGRPKGVVVPHRGIGNLAAAQREAFGIEPGGRVLQFASFSFDAAVAEVAHTLLGGATLVMARPGQAGPELLGLLRDQAVTVATLPPALLAVLPADDLPALRTIASAGEAVSAEVVARWGAGRRFVNAYGPTETTVCATVSINPSTTGHPPIGKPIANVRTYVLDARMQPVPVGVPGELYVGGVGVARGYLGQPARTAERFVPDPFGGDAGARLYRTGDLGRWLPDGTIEFLGRADLQVKIRGFRIEPGEIEARLAEHADVREAVVVAREDVPGDRRLVAYYMGEEVGSDALRAHLSERLPEYMLPAAFVRLEALPLTPNGKVDRGALPAPEGDAFAARRYEAPVGEVEETLAAIWAELLGVERVGRGDNFFELGGHSLLAVRVVSRVRQVLGMEASLAHVFSHPTVQSLAARLAGDDDAQPSDRAIPIRPTGSRPPLFLAYDGTGSITYAQVLHPHIDADVPVYALPAPGPSEPPLRTVEAMATRLVRMIREVQPSGPYRLAGWSFGGVLAYEVAAQLIGRDEVVEFVGMFDSVCPAGSTATASSPAAPRDARMEHALILQVLRTADTMVDGGDEEKIAAAGDGDLETFILKCREDGLLPPHVTAAQARAVRDRIRGHDAALGEYSPQPIPVLIHQFSAADNRLSDPTRGWGAFHPQGWLRTTPVPGTHLSMMRPPNTATLGEALSRAVEGARDEAPPRSAAGGSPVVMLQDGAAGAAPLFCVPGAGSGVTSFVDLMLALDPSVPVYGLQPRGLDGEAPPHASVQAAAEHYLRALAEACPAGPVHLLGHSFGGWVALEVALRLHQAGRTVASLTILDSEVPNDSEAVVREYGGAEAFLELVTVLELATEQSLGIGPAEVASRDQAGWLRLLHGKMVGLGLLGARTTPEVLTGSFRTFARCLRTAYRPLGIYPGPLRLVLVDDPAKDEAANRAMFAQAERGWREWAPGLVFSVGAGNHVTALKPPHVAALAGLLTEDRRAHEG